MVAREGLLDGRGELLRTILVEECSKRALWYRSDSPLAARRSRSVDAAGSPRRPRHQHILETRRRQRGLKPPMPMVLPDRPRLRDLDVTPHRLELDPG